MQLGLYCSSTMFTASSASRRRDLDPSAPIVLRTPVSWGSEPPVPQTASDARHHPSTTAPRRFFLQELRACQKASAFTFCFQISRAKLIYSTQSICLSSGGNLSHFALLAIVVHPFCPAHNSHDRLCGAMSAFIPRCQQDPWDLYRSEQKKACLALQIRSE